MKKVKVVGRNYALRTVAKSGPPYVAHMYELSYIVSVTKDKVILINAQSVVASPVPSGVRASRRATMSPFSELEREWARERDWW